MQLVGSKSEWSMPRPQTVRQALDWVSSNQGRGDVPYLNTEAVYLAGHSNGASMVRSRRALNFICVLSHT